MNTPLQHFKATVISLLNTGAAIALAYYIYQLL